MRGPDTTTTKGVTVGQPLRAGTGAHGEVHHVADHELAHTGDVVIKKFYDIPGHQAVAKQELENLRKVNKVRASGTHGGHTWAVVDKMPGAPLHDTQAYKNVEYDEDKLYALKRHAIELMGEAQLRYAIAYGIIHEYVFFSGTMFSTILPAYVVI
jgi:hypothetical protein